jgi:NhaP-type Na+/H+ or K+/H+ antiporter
MDPRLILFMFLPALIFEGAMCTDYFIFHNQFPGGLMLAGPGMLVQILLIALWASYCFPYGWGLTESFLFGSILSATDPVAVIALMKEMALLSDLRVLFEAESLLNDGTAIVVFELCLMVLLEPTSLFNYFRTCVQVHFKKHVRVKRTFDRSSI